MPGPRIKTDGLWQCVCPAVDAKFFIRAIEPRPVFQPRSRSIQFAQYPNRPNQRRNLHGKPRRQNEGVDLAPIFHKHETKSLAEVLTEEEPPYHILFNAPTSSIYDALRELRELDGQHDRILTYVRHLLRKRGEEPSLFVFETLIKANCSKRGSVKAVEQALHGMRKAKIEPSSSLYHAILKVLAVHPDYLQRSSILKEMKKHWIDLTPEGKQSVAIGLLRDGQYEMALDKLEIMLSQGVDVPPWLLDIFVYTLAQAGFLDEALKVVNLRLLREDDDITLNLWYFLLDICSRNYHHDGVKYVWARMVQPKILNPSDATCLHILNSAARHRDVVLAGKVMEHMSARGAKLGIHHFEVLLECYAGANDIENALQALCIMHSSGIQTDEHSTRSILISLKQMPSLAESAVEALFELRARYEVPLSAFNVIVEALVIQGEVRKAFDFYRHITQVCPGGPNLTTFTPFLQQCEDPKIVSFLAREMEAFSIKPNLENYDAIIFADATSGYLKNAMSYIFQLVDMQNAARDPTEVPWISKQTATALVKKCFAEEDPRVWDIAEASRKRGFPLDSILRDALVDKSEEKWTDIQVPNAVLQPVSAVH